MNDDYESEEDRWFAERFGRLNSLRVPVGPSTIEPSSEDSVQLRRARVAVAGIIAVAALGVGGWIVDRSNRAEAPVDVAGEPSTPGSTERETASPDEGVIESRQVPLAFGALDEGVALEEVEAVLHYDQAGDCLYLQSGSTRFGVAWSPEVEALQFVVGPAFEGPPPRVSLIDPTSSQLLAREDDQLTVAAVQTGTTEGPTCTASEDGVVLLVQSVFVRRSVGAFSTPAGPEYGYSIDVPRSAGEPTELWLHKNDLDESVSENEPVLVDPEPRWGSGINVFGISRLVRFPEGLPPGQTTLCADATIGPATWCAIGEIYEPVG